MKITDPGYDARALRVPVGIPAKGGYGYALALFAASLSRLLSGGGRIALDAALARRDDGGR